MTAAIQVRGLVKQFGDTRAVDGIDLTVRQGSVHGLLGPNGAGKTTTVRILSTLVRPDGGQALVAGFDVVRDAARVRGVIGLTGQYAAVDEQISGWDNLYLIGRLQNLTKPQARKRCDELLEQFDLADAARKIVRQYSGGMRRRLDLAASLVGRPWLLFLDEPTTGLDPRSRNALWDTVRHLVASGTTVLLTTQYMEEAEALAQSIDVIDRGRVVASGTPDQLRAQVGGKVLRLRPAIPAALEAIPRILSDIGLGSGTVDQAGGTYEVPLAGDSQLTAAVRQLGASGLPIANIETRLPSLDDVFLTLTGRPVTVQPENPGRGERPKKDKKKRQPRAGKGAPVADASGHPPVPDAGGAPGPRGPQYAPPPGQQVLAGGSFAAPPPAGGFVDAAHGRSVAHPSGVPANGVGGWGNGHRPPSEWPHNPR